MNDQKPLKVFFMQETKKAVSFTLRRALFLCTLETSGLQELADCASLLSALGMIEPARLLYDVLFIWRGFSPDSIKEQIEIITQTSLWPQRSVSLPQSAFTPTLSHKIDIAIENLRRVFCGNLDCAPCLNQGKDTTQQILSTAKSRPQQDEKTSLLLPLIDLCEELCHLLRETVRTKDNEALTKMLTELQNFVLTKAPFDFYEHAKLEVDEFAARLAFNSLHLFLMQNLDFAFAPLGSPSLFHMVSRFELAGLGPYCSKADSLVRNGKEIIALVQLAGREREATLDAGVISKWAFFISMRLQHPRVDEAIDDFADIGMLQPLWYHYTRLVRQRALKETDRSLLWRIRDAGIDNDDLQLALAAQSLIAKQWEEDNVEWIILGDLAITAGDTKQAEGIFHNILSREPHNKAALERLKAIKTGETERFTILRGYGTSQARLKIRALNLELKNSREIELLRQDIVNLTQK